MLFCDKSFLLGLEKCDNKWINISKNFVPLKTPSQIASHTQKYFKGKNVPQKGKEEAS